MIQINSDLGEIKLDKNLIQQTVETAALGVEGVCSLAITTEKWLSQALSRLRINGIKIDSNKGIRIEVPIIVKYGYNVPEVAVSVQEKIMEMLSKNLDLDAAYIIIKVKGLER